MRGRQGNEIKSGRILDTSLSRNVCWPNWLLRLRPPRHYSRWNGIWWQKCSCLPLLLEPRTGPPARPAWLCCCCRRLGHKFTVADKANWEKEEKEKEAEDSSTWVQSRHYQEDGCRTLLIVWCGTSSSQRLNEKNVCSSTDRVMKIGGEKVGKRGRRKRLQQ